MAAHKRANQIYQSSSVGVCWLAGCQFLAEYRVLRQCSAETKDEVWIFRKSYVLLVRNRLRTAILYYWTKTALLPARSSNRKDFERPVKASPSFWNSFL